MPAIDHIVLVAESLEQGAEFVAQQLRVTPVYAWRNEVFGTHSLALRLGPAAFLEVVAVDADAPPPARPRWYQLDEPEMQRTLMRRPRLFGWVVRVEDIDAAIGSAQFAVGEAVAFAQGGLAWRQSVPRDGALVLFGAGPSLIEREGSGHPAQWLPDQGCALDRLTNSDEAPARMRALLASVGAETLVAFQQGNRGESRFEVTITTPHGGGLLL